MMKVKSYQQFEKAVYRIIKANKNVFHPELAEKKCHPEPVILSLPKDEPMPKEANVQPTPSPSGRVGVGLFHCYVTGDIFRISTGAKVQDFDFSHFKSDEEICNYISRAIEILRTAIPFPPEGVPETRGKLLLDDYTETISLLR